MFICMPKINFIYRLFLEVLRFKESCNLIGQQYFGPKLMIQNFARYGIGGEISITIVFIFDYYQEKLMAKFFKKTQKPYFGAILGPFYPNLGKKDFPRKKRLYQLLILQLSTIVQKIRKN